MMWRGMGVHGVVCSEVREAKGGRGGGEGEEGVRSERSSAADCRDGNGTVREGFSV